MDLSFHYYATYCAAYLAGYAHEDCLEICYAAHLPDGCTRTFLERVGGPSAAATTQLPGEMGEARTDPAGIADITRIWASFHFLPRDLSAPVSKGGKRYRDKYRLICGPNGDLLAETVRLAEGRGTPAAGLAMHVLADTWAHRYFAGTPSLVINNTDRYFVELVRPQDIGLDDPSDELIERPIKFRHNPVAPDDLVNGIYTNSIFQPVENAMMNLGHGRAGHLPDYSFVRYRYVPAWSDYEELLKDNPSEYYQAFCQMVYALRCLRGECGPFHTDVYDTDVVAPYEQTIRDLLERRQLKKPACEDWRRFGEQLSHQTIPEFELNAHVREYQEASEEKKDNTFLGRFFLAALAQKGMVTNRIYTSGNPLAGKTIEFDERGFAGISDFFPLLRYLRGGRDG